MKILSALSALTLTLFLSLSSLNLNAQNDYNKTDNQGRRQGKWVDFHNNGKIRYTGEFKNNEPIGEFLYYSEEGVLVAKNNYIKKSNISETEIYASNGNVIAKGKYQDKKKIKVFDGNKYICFCDREAVGSDGTVYKRISLSEAISQKSIFLIGPEGDFSPEEINFALENGFESISLGNQRLRTETAAVAATIMVATINGL